MIAGGQPLQLATRRERPSCCKLSTGRTAERGRAFEVKVIKLARGTTRRLVRTCTQTRRNAASPICTPHVTTVAAWRKPLRPHSAEQLYIDAQRFETGDGVEEDMEVAIIHMKLAAQRGHAGAQTTLAGWYAPRVL